MRSKEKYYSFYRPTVTYDEYKDRILDNKQLDDIKLWLVEKNINKYEAYTIEGLKYDYIAISKDQRPQKEDLIDNKRVVYTQKVDKFLYIYLENIIGDDTHDSN